MCEPSAGIVRTRDEKECDSTKKFKQDNADQHQFQAPDQFYPQDIQKPQCEPNLAQTTERQYCPKEERKELHAPGILLGNHSSGQQLYGQDDQGFTQGGQMSSQQFYGQEKNVGVEVADMGEEEAHRNGSGDAQACPLSAPALSTDGEAGFMSSSKLMKQIGEDLHYVHDAFKPVFEECESAESVNIENLDSLLMQAKAYEQSLLDQKEQLRGRLGMLSQTLKLM